MGAHKLITAILPQDAGALTLLKRLKDEQAVASANLGFARGMGRVTRDRSGPTGQSQREVLSVVVPAERCDALFDWLCDAARIDRPHGGIIYVQPLAEATAYSLPDLPDEVDEPGD